MTEARIFLSSVTKELGSYRDELARLLRMRGYVVKIQEEFQSGPGTLLEKLYNYIQDCHAVVCLVGDRYGAEPSGDEATRFAFSFGAADFGATPRHSYTQWEYLFARRLNKALFVFMPSPQAARDPAHLERPESPEEAALQKSFVKREIERQGKDRSYFDSLAKLKEGVMVIDFGRLAEAGLHQVKLVPQSPYVGLRQFREEDRNYFFGRDLIVAETLAAVESNPLLLVLGNSGSGKSSMVRAGVIPEWRRKKAERGKVITFRPDADPFESFYAGLLHADYSQEQAKLARAISPTALSDTVAALRQPGEQWLLFIDQFEEIFTRPPNEKSARERVQVFAAALVDLANRADPGLHAVLTMRDDFFSNLEQHAELCAIMDDSFIRVTRMTAAELKAVIRNPAAANGVGFEHGLVELILGEVEDPRGRLPLPLLQYTLDILWKNDDVSDRLLNLSTYQRIGGVKGALQQRISQYYGQLGDDHQRSLRRIFLRLVRFSDAELPVSQSARKDELDSGADHKVLEDLLEREKLLVAREDTVGGRRISTVELAHEALISGWSEFGQWIAESREAVALRHRIRNDALQWKSLCQSPESHVRRRAEAELWTGARLERALELQEIGEFERIGGLSPLESNFMRESAQQRSRELYRLRRRIVVLGVLSLMALAAGGLALLKQREAVHQRDEARYNEGLGWMLRAEVAVERHNQSPDSSLYAANAIGFEGAGRRGDSTAAAFTRFIRQDRNPDAYDRAASWHAKHPAYLPVWSCAASPSPVTGLDISPDGRHLAAAAADGSVRLWDLRQGTQKLVQAATGQGGGLAFDPSGGTLAYANAAGLHLDDLASGKSVISPAAAGELAFSPTARILVMAAPDGSLVLRSGEKSTHISSGLQEQALALSFSSDSSCAAAAFPSGVRVFFPRYASTASAWSGHAGPCSAVALDPEGRRLALGTPAGDLLIYEVSKAELVGRNAEVHRHAGALTDLAFRQDGRQLATASADGSVRLWDVGQPVPKVIATLRGHRGGVARLCYFPGGELLASAGVDGSVRIWDVAPESGVPGDLQKYLRDSWYGFDPVTKELSWLGAEGVANVRPGSLLGLHRAQADVVPGLVAARAWSGLPPGAAPQAAIAIMADAEAAAQAGEWSRVELRLDQLERLGSDSGSGLRERQRALLQKGEPFVTPPGMQFLWCKPGEFTMGRAREEGEGELPKFQKQHLAKLTRGYWLAQTEVSQAQWLAVMGGRNPSTRVDPQLQAPVENISWEEAMDFCHRLTDRDRARGVLPPDWSYTLPTQTQWEYACRAGSTTAYNFGDSPDELHLHGNYADFSYDPDTDQTKNDGVEYLAPVLSYPPNAWGFHNMHGNVHEWCMDSVNPKTRVGEFSPEDGSPVAVESHRVQRGGGYDSPAESCSSCSLLANPPTDRSFNTGFRPALIATAPGP